MPKLTIEIDPKTIHGLPLDHRTRYRPFILKFMPAGSVFKLSWRPDSYMKTKALPNNMPQPRQHSPVIDLHTGEMEFVPDRTAVIPLRDTTLRNDPKFLHQVFEY